MTGGLRWSAMLLALCTCGPAAAQTAAQINDDRARLGRFQPPPSLPTVQGTAPRQPIAAESDDNGTAGQPPRRPWRELVDSLLDMAATRQMLTGQMIDDPLTTGFGNSDFVEPPPPAGLFSNVKTQPGERSPLPRP